MRTRFKKVWCGECHSMQFAGECGHGLVVDDVDPKLRYVLAVVAERTPPFHRADRVAEAMCLIENATINPDPKIWRRYK